MYALVLYGSATVLIASGVQVFHCGGGCMWFNAMMGELVNRMGGDPLNQSIMVDSMSLDPAVTFQSPAGKYTLICIRSLETRQAVKTTVFVFLIFLLYRLLHARLILRCVQGHPRGNRLCSIRKARHCSSEAKVSLLTLLHLQSMSRRSFGFAITFLLGCYFAALDAASSGHLTAPPKQSNEQELPQYFCVTLCYFQLFFIMQMQFERVEAVLYTIIIVKFALQSMQSFRESFRK